MLKRLAGPCGGRPGAKRPGSDVDDRSEQKRPPFVIEVVLPLLGMVPAERMPSDQFGERLAQWLATFDEDIELVSDAGCDWWLVNGMAYAAFQQLPHKVLGQVWQMTDDVEILATLQQAEQHFWNSNRLQQHHALFDARRLRQIADLQRELLASF